MSFFLLGKTADGKLSLLSETVYGTRPDALAELSRLTSSPDFDAWDTDVLVLDIDTGTPVLLVRPASTPAVETHDGDTTQDDGVAEAAIEQDAALAAVLQDLEDEEPAAEDVDLALESPTEEASPTEPIAEDAFVVEAEEQPVVEVDEAWAAALDDAASDSSLKGALLRTAAQMEAQGISAPASVGPADATEEPADEPADDVDSLLADALTDIGAPDATPAEAAEVAPVTNDGADAPDSALRETEAANEGEPEGETVDDEAAEIETAVALEAEESAGAEEAAEAEPAPDAEDTPDTEVAPESEFEAAPSAQEPSDASAIIPAIWPWDAAPDAASSGLAGLEEPGLDTESMIRALADDEASRTVVLGEYEAPPAVPIEPELIVSAAAIAEEAADAAALEAEPDTTEDHPPADDAGEALPDTPEAVLPDAAVAPAPPEPVSDFIDLGDVPQVPAKSYEPGKPDIDGMTCDDCVYVDTCPNKEERIPATCGSFQWK